MIKDELSYKLFSTLPNCLPGSCSRSWVRIKKIKGDWGRKRAGLGESMGKGAREGWVRESF